MFGFMAVKTVLDLRGAFRKKKMDRFLAISMLQKISPNARLVSNKW